MWTLNPGEVETREGPRSRIALGSELAGPSDLDRAEALLSSHLAAIVSAYASENP